MIADLTAADAAIFAAIYARLYAQLGACVAVHVAHVGERHRDDERGDGVGGRTAQEQTMFYAVAHHGTAGFDSYGYAERWDGDPPRADQTTTIRGPFATAGEADAEVESMNADFARWRATMAEDTP